jgi:hypothetical protein
MLEENQATHSSDQTNDITGTVASQGDSCFDWIDCSVATLFYKWRID